MEDLSLHILDIVENAIAAKANQIDIAVIEDSGENRLVIEIEDDGIGMDEETSQRALDPFFTTRSTRRVGLGLSLMAQACQEAGGNLQIESRSGKGTKVKAVFQYDHIDRKPLGSMSETIIMLLLGNPELNISYTHQKQGKSYRLSSQALKEHFRGRPLIDPEVIQWLKNHLKDGLAQIGVQG